LKDFVQKARGKNIVRRKDSTKKGTSNNLATGYANTIRGFYRSNGFPTAMKIKKGLPKRENFKLALRIPEIKSAKKYLRGTKDFWWTNLSSPDKIKKSQIIIKLFDESHANRIVKLFYNSEKRVV
jgi:hypothetical protein